MDNVLNVKVISPSASLFEGSAEEVSVPTSKGYIGVRYNHNALVSSLGIGKLEIRGQDKKNFFVSGGYIEVFQNSVTLLVSVIEDISKIDSQRAEGAEKRAAQRLATRTHEEALDISRALAALERARARKKLAELSRR
ncbi:MAG: ATP synthase F1 subunit epsilon [Pseudomonadota bacterium]